MTEETEARGAHDVTHDRDAGARRYEILVRGELGDHFQTVFGDVLLRRSDGTTALICVGDQADLRALLERIQELGLDLLSVKQVDCAE